ncbi:MAG TPA: glycoside hydrolase family 2 TIM barrel-domain containing protein [Streptosporangiaceae bacterium]|nr:glycoside hydrolase family 2 TIM barrel-domain containing protein [Streptosporangiaceae bacterium]
MGEFQRADGQPVLVGRRHFLSAVLGGAAGWPALRSSPGGPRPATGASRSPGAGGGRGHAAATIAFNTGWRFGAAADGSSLPGFDDSAFATVTLPHTVAPLSWQNWDPASWEQVWTYRKHFDAPSATSGMRVFLDFGAVMTRATVTLNGSEVADHLGGYLPFSAEITAALKPTGNVLAVQVDSTFNLDVPPDRPAPAVSTSVDFWQPGGIYRDVRLRIVPRVFLADVFAKPVNVLDAAARQVVAEVTVDAAAVCGRTVGVAAVLLDGTRTLAAGQAPVAITGPGTTTAAVTLSGLSDITLWDIGSPKLYDVVATLLVDGGPVHDYRVRIGFREAAFTPGGFYLNGRQVKLFGVNRHQFFPFAGGAMPGRVQAADARIIRDELNCNMVRCSHYPQSEAFLDACDEIGLMVWEEAPGWGYLGDAPWLALAGRDIADMIVRDRNHPSIIIWGARLNETPGDTAFYTSTNELAHVLDDSRPTAGAMAGQHLTADYQQDVFAENDYSFVIHPTGNREPALQPPLDGAARPYLVTEAVGTLSGPAIYYRRTDIQVVQQGQAVAHGQVHNLAAGDDRYAGLLAWSGFDYPSGNGNQYQGVKYTGVVDGFRVLKPGAALYQAQADPSITPVIAPAFYWDFGPVSPVTDLSGAMICSNLDRLEVYVGGEYLGTATPNSAAYPNLRYPPSFADFTAVDGSSRPELRIDGYLGPARVASRRFSADPSGDRLWLAADDAEIDGDGVDATRLTFRAVDRYGAPRPYAAGQVTLDLAGPAVLVGDNPFDFASAGGAGAVWIRSLPGSPGTVTVTASHPALGSAVARIRVRAVPGAGRPVPYGTLQVQAAPGLVPPGGTTTVTATFANNGILVLDRVGLAATAPSGWTVTAQWPAAAERVRSGQVLQASWQIAVPPDAHPGQSPVIVQAVYTAGDQRGVSYGSVSVLGAYATVADAFNNTGISAENDASAADFDGTGTSYSEQALTSVALGPGAVVTHDGLTFTWPDVPAGQPDNVVAAGQTILLSGSGTTLGFLGAAGSGGQHGPGTVYYTDGSTASFQLSLASYLGPPGPGDDPVAVVPYLNGSAAGQPGYVFYAGVPITPAKTVQAVTLPKHGSGSPSGMHIFAAGIGPLQLPD